MTRLGIAFAAGMLVVGCLVLTAVVGCSDSAPQSEVLAAGSQASALAKTPSVDQNEGTGKGMAALREAAQSGKYLFAFFFKAKDEQTLAMRKVFDKAMEKLADRTRRVAVNITDASERAVVDKFDLSRAPMPLVLAIAPNGAITGGFPTTFEEQQLVDAFATPGTERVMKSLQDGKLVFVCVQNDKTKSNDAAMQGVRDFQADVRFASATEIVTLDPAEKKEASFLKDLRVSPDTAEAVTVFLAPPGKAIGKFEGATNKDALAELISKASSGCCCGPNGCGPGGCCPKKE
jgi:hypothetical protein